MRGGECKVFERPQYIVLGKRQYDQRWIDGNVEAGVGACGWHRPAKRPKEFDAPAARPEAGSVTPLPVKKKRGVVRRTIDRVLHRPAPGTVERVPAPRPAEAPAEPPIVAEPVVLEQPPRPPPSPPPLPRKPADELLSPSAPLPPEPPANRAKSLRCRLGMGC